MTVNDLEVALRARCHYVNVNECSEVKRPVSAVSVTRVTCEVSREAAREQLETEPWENSELNQDGGD